MTEQHNNSKLTGAVLPFFFAFPCLLVTLAIRFGPSWVETDLLPRFSDLAVPLSVGAWLGVGFVFAMVFRLRSFSGFTVSMVVTIVMLSLAMFFLGVSVHRDYFTAVFQYIFLIPAIFLYRMATVGELTLSRSLIRQIARVGYGIAIFYTQWVMLMGYAISSRAEPRPVEAVAYNVYNLVLVLVMFFLSHMVEGRFFHQVSIGADSVSVDGKNIATMLGQKKVRILRAFSTAENRTLRCQELQRLDDGGEGTVDCDRCADEATKAALCRRYRATYNSLLEIKKVLEFFEIATLLPPDNKRRVLTDGWKLSFFENVRVRVHQ